MRKIKTRGHFPNADAVTELILLIVSLLDGYDGGEIVVRQNHVGCFFPERHNQSLVVSFRLRH